jgi:PAS domain S-box-containing protein
VVEEVTERKAAEAALRRVNETLEQRVAERTGELEAISAERARLASVAENSPTFIGICDLDMRVIYVNPAGRRLVGIARDEELQRRTLLEYFVPEESARVGQEVLPAVLKDGHWVGELTFRHFRTGERISVLYDVFRIDDPTTGKPSHFATVTRDLRERKQAEERLRQAQKMEAVGQLTGGIAHDFNNLLTVIIANLERLRLRLADQPHLRRLVEAMERAAERGERMTGQLLAFSRRQQLRPETLDLNTLIRGFEPMICQAVGESVEVEAHLAPDLWSCTIDAAQLETVLLNLAVNARDAMPEGGRLVVETQNVERDDRLTARVAGASAGPYLTLTLSDTGTGMPPEVVALAFEPFFTTKEVGKGSGLGLSQVYGFVEQSGGHVTIESELGQGTIVRLYLPPVVSAAATLQPAQPLHRTASASGSEHVLLVEDDAYVLSTATEMMTELGYEVRAVAGPLEALEMLRGGARVDVLFSDVVMPIMSGIRLAEEARRLRPGLKVLLTSGYSREDLWSRTDAGASLPILPKPYKQTDLAAQLRAVLDAG